MKKDSADVWASGRFTRACEYLYGGLRFALTGIVFFCSMWLCELILGFHYLALLLFRHFKIPNTLEFSVSTSLVACRPGISG